MANAKIMPRDVSGLGTLTTVSGTEVTTLPSSNMLTYGRTPTARWSTPITVQFKMTWASVQEIDTVALCFHNLSLGSTWNIALFSDVACSVFLTGTGTVNAFQPSGFTPILADVSIPEFRQFKNSAAYVSRQTTVRGIVITLYDSANVDGFIEAGRLMMGRSEQFVYGDPFGGVNLQIKDLSTSARAGNGSVITDKGQAFREIQINKQYISEVPDASGNSDWNKLLEAYIRCGSDKEFFYSQFPSANSGTGTTEEIYYQGAFKFGAMSAIDREFFKQSRTQFTLAGQ